MKYNIVQILVLMHTLTFVATLKRGLSSFTDFEGIEFSQRACVVLIYFRLVFKPCEALIKHMSCHGVGDRTDILDSPSSDSCHLPGQALPLKEHSHRFLLVHTHVHTFCT